MFNRVVWTGRVQHVQEIPPVGDFVGAIIRSGEWIVEAFERFTINPTAEYLQDVAYGCNDFDRSANFAEAGYEDIENSKAGLIYFGDGDKELSKNFGLLVETFVKLIGKAGWKDILGSRDIVGWKDVPIVSDDDISRLELVDEISRFKAALDKLTKTWERVKPQCLKSTAREYERVAGVPLLDIPWSSWGGELTNNEYTKAKAVHERECSKSTVESRTIEPEFKRRTDYLQHLRARNPDMKLEIIAEKTNAYSDEHDLGWPRLWNEHNDPDSRFKAGQAAGAVLYRASKSGKPKTKPVKGASRALKPKSPPTKNASRKKQSASR